MTLMVESVTGFFDRFFLFRSHIQTGRSRGSAALHQLLERANEKPEEAEGLEAFSFWACSICVFSEAERTSIMDCTDTVTRMELARDNTMVRAGS